MNKITKKSFYSFLALYIISTFGFLFLAAYWFFNSQVAMEKNNNFYKMNHIADVVSSHVIKAQMKKTVFELDIFPMANVSLLDINKRTVYGSLAKKIDFSSAFYMNDGSFTLISQRTTGHLGIKYVVVQSSECMSNIEILKNKIFYNLVA